MLPDAPTADELGVKYNASFISFGHKDCHGNSIIVQIDYLAWCQVPAFNNFMRRSSGIPFTARGDDVDPSQSLGTLKRENERLLEKLMVIDRESKRLKGCCDELVGVEDNNKTLAKNLKSMQLLMKQAGSFQQELQKKIGFQYELVPSSRELKIFGPTIWRVVSAFVLINEDGSFTTHDGELVHVEASQLVNNSHEYLVQWTWFAKYAGTTLLTRYWYTGSNIFIGKWSSLEAHVARAKRMHEKAKAKEQSSSSDECFLHILYMRLHVMRAAYQHTFQSQPHCLILDTLPEFLHRILIK